MVVTRMRIKHLIFLPVPFISFYLNAASLDEINQKLDEGYRYACNATQTGNAEATSLALENYRTKFINSASRSGFSEIMNVEINKVVAEFFRKGMIQGNTSTGACETPAELLLQTSQAVYSRQSKSALASALDGVRFTEYAAQAYPIFYSIQSTGISEDEVIEQINKIGNNAIINNQNAIDVSNATNAMKEVAKVLFSARSDPELMKFMMDYINNHKLH